MTIRHEPTLWCDGIEDDTVSSGVRHAEPTQTSGPRGVTNFGQDGCPFWIQDGRDTKAIRANAKRVGWRRIDGRDYSPQCARLLESRRSAPTGQEASGGAAAE